MNTALVPEMLHYCTDMTVLERQRARLKWQQEQEQQPPLQVQGQENEGYFGDFSGVFQQQQFQGDLGEVVIRSVKPDPCLMDTTWTSDFAGLGPCGFGTSNNGSGFDANFAISRTASCPPTGPAAVLPKGRESVLSKKSSSGVGRESFKKRKVDKLQNNIEAVAEEDSRDKRIKVISEEGESKITDKTNNKTTSSNSKNSNKENSGETSKDNSKVTEVQKPDYIHVRARRGQATDSHSLAERVRREKISERMKYLQDLVPGCNKITGKAGMLDEIINYVQSLQRQVEFLSMKLAAVNPRIDFNIDNLFAKESLAPCATNFPAIGISTDMTNPAYLQFNAAQQQQLVTCCGLNMGIIPPDMGLRRTISAPVSVHETFIDSSCYTQIQASSTWDADLHNLYNVAFDQGRSTSFPTHQPFTGSIETSNLKMEM